MRYLLLCPLLAEEGLVSYVLSARCGGGRGAGGHASEGVEWGGARLSSAFVVASERLLVVGPQEIVVFFVGKLVHTGQVPFTCRCSMLVGSSQMVPFDCREVASISLNHKSLSSTTVGCGQLLIIRAVSQKESIP